MPTYEYRCDKCEHEFEREQRITADPVKTCPECRSRRVKRLISQTSFVLKGGGWYSDLYSSGSKSKSGDSGGEGTGAKDSASQSDSSDSKPSEKSSAKKDSPKKAKKASKPSQPSA